MPMPCWSVPDLVGRRRDREGLNLVTAYTCWKLRGVRFAHSASPLESLLPPTGHEAKPAQYPAFRGGRAAARLRRQARGKAFPRVTGRAASMGESGWHLRGDDRCADRLPGVAGGALHNPPVDRRDPPDLERRHRKV